MEILNDILKKLRSIGVDANASHDNENAKAKEKKRETLFDSRMSDEIDDYSIISKADTNAAETKKISSDTSVEVSIQTASSNGGYSTDAKGRLMKENVPFTGTYDGKRYVAGRLFSGFHNGVEYENGVLKPADVGTIETTPIIPSVPTIETVPSDPTVETTPTVPSEPTVSTTPTVPSDPTVETTPTIPDEPTVSTTPTVPSDPTVETTPTVPDESTVSTTPTVPSDPTVETTPTVPDEPTVSTTPTIPSTPTVETTPTVPDESTVSTTPTIPADPTVETTPTVPTIPAGELGSKEFVSDVLKTLSGLGNFNIENYDLTIDNETGKITKLSLKDSQTESIFLENKKCSNKEINIIYNSDGTITIKPSSKEEGTDTEIYFSSEHKISSAKTTLQDGTVAVYAYDENGKRVSAEKTAANGDVTSYTYTNGVLSSSVKTAANGTITTYAYNSKGVVISARSVTAKGVVYEYAYTNGKKSGLVKYTYNENNNVSSKKTYSYDENGKNAVLKTQTSYSYNKENQLICEETTKSNGDKLTRKYLEYNGDYPTKYSIEYNYANGIHTESIIKQRKLEIGSGDYIESSENYQWINGKKLLISTLETGDVIDSKGVVHEGTHRTFYFYDENGNKIKKEYTESCNGKEVEGKPIKTNSGFQKQNKLVTTYNPDTGLKTSEVRYSSKNITTTYYEADGETIKTTKKETFEENSYINHNLNNVSREEFLAEAEKYIGFNKYDGSYSIFGTNGSPCATFTTYIMYQLGFDLTSVITRTTQGLRNQAINEGRSITAEEVFERLKNGEQIENMIRPGDILTQTNAYGSHTTIVKEVSYDSETGVISYTVIGAEGGSPDIPGIDEDNSRKIKLNENGEVIRIDKKGTVYSVVFCDYISSPEEIAQRNNSTSTVETTPTVPTELTVSTTPTESPTLSIPVSAASSKDFVSDVLKTLSGLGNFNIENYDLTIDNETGKITKLSLKDSQTESVFLENKKCSNKEINIIYNSDGTITIKPSSKEEGTDTEIYFSSEHKISSAKTTLQDGTVAVYAYDENGKRVSAEKTAANGDVTNYTYTNGVLSSAVKTAANGTITTYAYNSKGVVISARSVTAKGVVYEYTYTNGKKSGLEKYTYNENNNVSSKKTYSYDENGKNATLKTQINYKYDENGEIKNETKTSYTYNKENQLICEETTKNNGDKLTRKYLEYNGDYPTKYSIEYNYANGIHTESIIKQRKLEIGSGDYIESSENYQWINGKKFLISTLETGDVTDSKGVVHEGTHRTFYFYDENGNKIKKEYTEFYNNPEQPGLTIIRSGTNGHFQAQNKLVTTYDPDTGLKTSEIRYSKKDITTTYFEPDGETIKNEVKETYEENSYINHNLNNVSREEFLAEAEKYIGYTPVDGSYSIFGTNGSPCATFTTYVLYQLGFDLNSVLSRTTHRLRNQAINEGRSITAEETFERLKNGEQIENIIRPGDIFTRTTDAGGSHTTIVKDASYDSETGEITLNIIGAEGTYGAISKAVYKLKLGENGEVIRMRGNTVESNVRVVFCDYISSPEEIAQRNNPASTVETTPTVLTEPTISTNSAVETTPTVSTETTVPIETTASTVPSVPTIPAGERGSFDWVVDFIDTELNAKDFDEIKKDDDGKITNIKFDKIEYVINYKDNCTEISIRDNNKLYSVTEYNTDKKETKLSIYSNEKISSVSEYNPETGNKITEVNYNSNGILSSSVNYEYDSKTNNKTKETKYNDNGALTSVTEYNPETGNKVKETEYDKDNIIKFYREYDPTTGNTIKVNNYNSKGKLSSYVNYEYDSITGNIVKELTYDTTTEYDPTTGKKIKETKYGSNGIVDNSIEYDVETGNVIKEVTRNTKQNITYISEYDPNTGNKIKETSDLNIKYEYDSKGNKTKENKYNIDGKLIYSANFDPKTGNMINEISYNTEGKILSAIEYNPTTSNILKQQEYKYYDSWYSVVTTSYDSKTGNIIKQTEDGTGGYSYIRDYDSTTGNILSVRYLSGGIDRSTVYDSKTGRIIKTTDNGAVTKYEYDNETGNVIKVSKYDANGKLISITKGKQETKYDSTGKVSSVFIGGSSDTHNSGKEIKYDSKGNIIFVGNLAMFGKYNNYTQFDSNGNVTSIIENDVNHSKLKETKFGSNGSVTYSAQYDYQSQLLEEIKYNSAGKVTSIIEKNLKINTSYDSKGEISSVKIYDNTTAQKSLLMKEITYSNGKIASVIEYNSLTSKKIKDTKYDKDGIIISVTDYSSDKGTKVKEALYTAGELSSVKEFDWTTEKIVKETFYDTDGNEINSNIYEENITSSPELKAEETGSFEYVNSLFEKAGLENLNPENIKITKDAKGKITGILSNDENITITYYSKSNNNSYDNIEIQIENTEDNSKKIYQYIKNSNDNTFRFEEDYYREYKYNSATGMLVKYIAATDSCEFDSTTGNLTKGPSYDRWGRVESWGKDKSLIEYDSNTGRKIKESEKGSVVEYEYYNSTGYLSKETKYDSKGNLTSTIEYNIYGFKTKETKYDSKGIVTSLIEYDPESGNIISESTYNSDGNIKCLAEYKAMNIVTYYSWGESNYSTSCNKVKKTNYNSEGEITDLIEYEYDSKGNAIKETTNGKITYLAEYNSETNKISKETKYNLEGTITYLAEYNSNGKIIKKIENGELTYLIEFDPETGNQIKKTEYDSKTKETSVKEWDNITGNMVKETKYNANGEVIYLSEYELATGKNIKETCYDSKKKETSVKEWNLLNKKLSKETRYNSNGEVTFLAEYDANGNKIKETNNGQITYLAEYNSLGNKVKETRYYSDGNLSYLAEYDSNGNKIKETNYDSKGKTKNSYEYDPESGNKIKEIIYSTKDGADFTYEYDYISGKIICNYAS